MAERKQGDQGTGDRSAVITQTKTRTQRPSMYRVLILNDDYTPMEFVVYVLEQYFHKSREEATRIMLHVHQTGVGPGMLSPGMVIQYTVNLMRSNKNPWDLDE